MTEPARPERSDGSDEGVRRRLVEDAAAARERLRALGASYDDIVEAARDSNLDDEHDPEGLTIAAERSLVGSLAAQAERAITASELALARLDDGTYGRCQGCGQDIPPARLEARPTTTLCLPCAAQV